jgi:hypothetical protein
MESISRDVGETTTASYWKIHEEVSTVETTATDRIVFVVVSPLERVSKNNKRTDHVYDTSRNESIKLDRMSTVLHGPQITNVVGRGSMVAKEYNVGGHVVHAGLQLSWYTNNADGRVFELGDQTYAPNPKTVHDTVDRIDRDRLRWS